MKVLKLASKSALLLVSLFYFVSMSNDGRQADQARSQRSLDERREVTCVPQTVPLCRDTYRSWRSRYRRESSREREHLRVLKNRYTKYIRRVRNTSRKLDRYYDNLQRCPAGFFGHHKKCYLFSTLQKSWYEARNTCSLLGGTLLSIENAGEFQYIHKRLSKMKNVSRFWLGFARGIKTENDLEVKHYKIGENPSHPLTYDWIRTGVNYTTISCPHTESPQPHNRIECGLLRKDCSWKMELHNCDISAPFICETGD